MHAPSACVPTHRAATTVACRPRNQCYSLQSHASILQVRFKGVPIRRQMHNGTKCRAFFKLGGQTSSGGGVYGAQQRADYTSDDVEQYFNYMGMLAEQGSYEALEKVLASDIHPADLLLQWASAEGDTPKAAELLRAGANPDAQNLEGKTPAELTKSEEIKEMLMDPKKAQDFEEE